MKTCIVTILFAIATICSTILYARLDFTASQLEKANKDLADVRNSLEQSRRECTILKEDSARAQAAMDSYTKSVEDIRETHADLCKRLQEDGTAVDWLHASLPDSIRLLYNCPGDSDGIRQAETAGSSL